MSRLNKAIRKQIIANGVKKANFHIEEARLKQVENKLAALIVDKAIGGPKVLERLKAFEEEFLAIKEMNESLMTCWYSPFSKSARISVRTTSGHRYELGLSSARIVQNDLIHLDEKDSAEVKRLKDDQKNVELIRQKVIGDITARVYGFTTVEKLLKEWPECKELLPEMATGGAGLPALKNDDINKLLGLGGK